MSRLQTIENQLNAINETVFQELCDSFLILRNKNYLSFSRTGSQTGKQKTTKGTPDSFFLLPNGNYTFIETTTNTSDKEKLSNDIKACFNFKKSKIQSNKIEEIILCFNWNINQEQIEELNNLAKSYNKFTRITYYMLDTLAIELHLNHRDLAHQYLGLPLDTGQIVSIENFIKEYDRASKGIATPLNNTFLHRETELNNLKDALSNHDFVILTGAPGIGKTKLAIETIKSYLEDNKSYQAFCVSYKSHTLLEGLYQYFDVKNNYILFVDDANRIDAFNQITGFYKANRTGKLKIIITVRDYAFQEIGLMCQEFSTKRIGLFKFTDEQIIDIIKTKPFEILNPDYHKEIVRIADGNPRLAIMTSLLAKKEQNLYALHNVSDLFEKYFSTFIKDDGEFSNPLNIKCLGLISFFYTIPYKNRKILNSILSNFNISYNEFIDTIDKLDKLELVEIQFEHVKIPEQNLATFFFYKVFIKDDLLSFQTLLKEYFENNHSRFTDSIIPANNTFGSQNVMDKLKPEILSYWQIINNDYNKSFSFVETFWFFLQEQTLEFIYNYINTLPKVIVSQYNTSYETNAFNYDKNKIIELIGNFFRLSVNSLKDAIELAFEYVKKKPEDLPELIHKIREVLPFDSDDESYDFYRQKTLFGILIDGINKKDFLLSTVLFELSKTFLSYKFQQFKSGRNNTISWYNYPIPNNRTIQEFRTKIWTTLDLNFKTFPVMAFDLLQNYSKVHPDVNKEIMEFDISYVLNIIDKHLSNENFEHCKYVQDQIKWFKRHDFDFPELTNFTNRFINETYMTFLKIDWDRYRDKEMYEFDDNEDYEKLKELEIRSSFLFNSNNEINSFYKTFITLKKSAKNDWNYNNTFDIVVDENCLKNFDLGCQLINKVIENKNRIKYVPRVVFKNHLKTENTTDQIWKVIQKNEFDLKELWELSFYDYLDDSLLNKDYIDLLVNTISNMRNPNTIHFDGLERFLSLEPNLFQIILKTITEKNKKENTQLQVWRGIFSKHFDKLGDDIELIKKAYIQQNLIQKHFDYEGKGLVEILKKDKNFLIEYIESLYSKTDRHSLGGDHSDMSFVWNINKIEETLLQVFDLVIKKDIYFGILEHFCNTFFRKPKKNCKDRADGFIRSYVKKNNTDYKKMQVIVDIIRHSRKELFEEILLLFISLNQDRGIFSKLSWISSGGTYAGNTIVGDVRASEWRNILSIVEKSDLGFKLLPIKTYLNERIESSLERGDMERQRRFLRKHY